MPRIASPVKHARLTSFLRAAFKSHFRFNATEGVQGMTRFNLPRYARQLTHGALATGILLGLSGQSFAAVTTVYTWTGATNNWDTSTNWTSVPAGGTFPQNPGDSAQFGAAGNPGPTNTATLFIEDITFQAGAQTYTVTNGANGTIFLEGNGIVNNSASIQTINNSTATSFLSFVLSSGAGGSNVIINNSGQAGAGVQFTNTSTAGAATINNNGANAVLFFSDSSLGGTSIINNSGTGSNTTFDVTSNAQNTTINNSGANSFTSLKGSATAGASTINNVDDTSQTIFDGNSLGGTSHVTNVGAAFITFKGNSNAQNSTLTNTGAGTISFAGSGNAGHAIINNTNASGQVTFADNSNAGTSTINNNGSVTFGTSAGSDAPSAGNATINNSGTNSATFFVANSTAGHSTVISSGDGSGVVIGQAGDPGGTGGDATFINSGHNSGLFITANGSGGNAAFVNANDTASIDISGINAAGTTAGSVAGNGTLVLGAKNLAVGSNNTSTTFSGVIQGAGGSLTKVGLGALTLTGANTYTGNTTVNGGALLVNGSIISPLTLVNQAGLLGGSGVIGGNVVNHGTVEPASTTTGLTVKGNYTQGADGNLRIDVGSNSNFGKLTVNGVANLAGSVTAVVAKGVKPKVGVSFRFLTAAGGVNGRFDDLIAPNNGTIVTLGLKYDANSVYLQFLQGKFAALNGLTYNQTAVAKNLDRVAFDSREKRLIGYLDSQPLAKLPHDFDLIAPEELSAVWASSFALANVQNANIQRRTDDIRNGSNGFSAAGLAMNGTNQSYSGPLQFRTGSAGPTGDGKESKEVYNPAPDNKWGVFLSGTGEWVNVGDTDNARGYNIDTGGFTLGLDYKITPNFAVGINAGYAGTGVDLTDKGRILVNGGKLGVYATYFTGGFYADASASGGYNSYDIRRHGLGGTVRGDTDGGEFNALFGTGYDFVLGGLKIGPTATFQYSYLGLSGYQEKGSLAPLAINSQSHDSLRTAFGLRAIYDWKVGGVIIRPEVRAAWQHEYGDRAYAVDSHFATGAGSDFSVDGPEMGRDSLLISAGLAILWNERTSTFLYYDGQVAGTNYDSHSITGGVRVAY